MINFIKVIGGGTLASVKVATSGMVLTVSAGYYTNGLGSLAWPVTEIAVPSPTADQHFVVWLLADGTIFPIMATAPNQPTAPTSMRERLVWGTIPANCTDLAAATINVLTLGGE